MERKLGSVTEMMGGGGRGQNEKEMSGKAPGLYHVSLTLPSFNALFRHTQLLLRLRPFAALDLVRNEPQSNSIQSNPQISESRPP